MKIFDTRRLRVRKLTPKEYGILQAFPMDSWEQAVSDSQAYKQFGNAVTKTVFTAVALEIKKSILQSESEEQGMNNEVTNTPTAESVVETAEAEDATEAVETTPEELPGFITPEDLAADITTALFEKTYLPGFCFDAANDCIFHFITEKAEGHLIATEKPEIKRDWEAACLWDHVRGKETPCFLKETVKPLSIADIALNLACEAVQVAAMLMKYEMSLGTGEREETDE